MILGKLDRKSILLPLRKTLHYFSQCFLVLQKKKSFYHLFSKCLIKRHQKRRRICSSVAQFLTSPEYSKHLAYVTQQAIAGDQVVYRMTIQNNVLCQWATLKDFQNAFRHRFVVQNGKKADGSLSMSPAERRHFVHSTMSRTKSR